MKPQYKRSICWIRRDLRLEDHRALYEACARSEEVLIAFVFDSVILKNLKDKKDPRVTFIHNTLVELDRELKGLGASLIWVHGDPVVEIPKLAAANKAQAIFANGDFETYAKTRDETVRARLSLQKIDFHLFKDHVIFSGLEIAKADGTPYRVFTPYKKIWLKTLSRESFREFKPDLNRLIKSSVIKSRIELKELGFKRQTLEDFQDPSGPQEALREFSEKINDYQQNRDFPAKPGTSRLSVHLRFGTLSIRACVRDCVSNPSVGAQTWLSELVWRDFYQMILDQFPHVEKNAFLGKYGKLKWPGKKAHFEAWCAGSTGYPIVDAAMRQLNQTGFMHNRLRMVAASFLVKDLLIDWRWGESYFAEKLMDFDLAANNGGWQWCASTGCDAQPYFRIFNPQSQSKRFDEAGNFIRKFVPELAKFSNKDIHFPAKARPGNIPTDFVLGKNYPEPIVEHSTQARKAVALFRGK